ncbi:MAG: 6-carboxytetrahydropterin synthase QueD [Candidatus Adiutrix sp.]|jgi:6-pyruvoyltetrahydropterin/6-carboxytetrahydropterin synthase|nr:6-carboxytetrahydropterin synthase QueD [Candidatus Adiutrix sp.]
MFELKVTQHFAAAHNLREFRGRCENLHGHNWFVEVRVRCQELDRTGLALDFGLIKKYLNEVLDLLDHRYLNELPAFQTRNPSSENIALFIFDHLAASVDRESGGRARLHSVSAWESDHASATYIADGA